MKRLPAKKRDEIARGNPSGYIEVPIYAMYPEHGHVKVPFYAMWDHDDQGSEDRQIDVVVRRMKGKKVVGMMMTVPSSCMNYGKKACRWITRNMPQFNSIKP